MITKIETFIQPFLKKDLSDLRPGDTVRVYQKITAFEKSFAGKKETLTDGRKEKLQIFEGLIIARKHGREAGSTITVRKVIFGIGVEMIFPLHSPNIEKIEVVKRGKVRRAKLYYLRKARGEKAKLKKKEIIETLAEEKPEAEISPEKLK